MKARLYLVQKMGPATFIVTGDNLEIKYRVTIGPQVRSVFDIYEYIVVHILQEMCYSLNIVCHKLYFLLQFLLLYKNGYLKIVLFYWYFF